MKTEHLTSGHDPIWTNNVELLTTEECLPVIGSCQVSSILQNLDGSTTDSNLQNMDLIILNANECKSSITEVHSKFNGNYVMVDETIKTETKNKLLVNEKHYDEEAFEDMLYFVCNLCPFLCTKDSKIKEHLENVHKNKTQSELVELKCPACANIFYHRASLKSHLLHDHCVSSHDLNLIVQAVIYYSNKNSTDDKFEEPNSKNGFKIPSKLEIKTIEKHSNSNDYIEIHTTELQKEKVTLPQVDLVPGNSEKLFTDMMRKPDPSMKYCGTPSCKVRLTDITKLTYHMGCHAGDSFKCPECNEKFMFWKPLSSHLWRLHKIDMELYSCDKCDYKTYSLSKLNTVHKLIHGDVKAFLCDTCHKAFKNIKQLRNHRVVHKEKTDKVGLKCEVCLKTFSDKKSIKNHIDTVHKKLKPYLCSYCGYKGSCRASLKMHVRLHTGEKPFSCAECSYTTADHNSLRRHKLRHSGQRPYKCVHCSYACIQSSTFKVHLKTKHPGMEKDLMFACAMCQFKTVNKDMYVSHLVTVHKEKPPKEL